MSSGSQVLESLTTSSLFGTGDAGAPGNHCSEDFSAPSQDGSKWPIGHHMIPPICYSIIAKLMPSLFFDDFFSDFCINWASIPRVAAQHAVVCILGKLYSVIFLCSTLNCFLFLGHVCFLCLSHTPANRFVICNCSSCNSNWWVTGKEQQQSNIIISWY